MSKRYPVLSNELGDLECEISKEGLFFLHLSLKKWNKTLYKQSLIYFYSWLNMLYESGVLAVFVLIPEEDKKLYKFEQMFGFEEIDRKNGYVLMAQGTGD